MICEKPYVTGGRAYGCGQCTPCRLYRSRVWSHRIMLEALEHEDNSFVTLTYDDEHLPKGGSLAPKDFQDWLKRYRKSIEPFKIRYYGVGEYGDQSSRPHYHVAIFGHPGCASGVSRYREGRRDCCSICNNVRDTWARGRVDVGALETKSAQYIAGYIIKKMTRRDDVRLNGREPEFARMSLRPGLGAHSIHEVASELMRFNLETTELDVPSTLRHGPKKLPLGRYLVQKLRLAVGKEKNAPEAVIEKMDEELLPLRAAAFDASEPLQKHVVEASRQKVRNVLARHRIHKQRKVL